MFKDKLLHRYVGAIAALVIISLLSSWTALPSQHEISNSWDGFLWGMAESVLALDKLVSIIAIGLLASRHVCGRWIAIEFVLASIFGTVIHLSKLNLPLTQTAIATVSIFFGAMLVTPKRPSLVTLLMLTAIAGLLQGYLSSESIMRVLTMPSMAYIFGSALTQCAVVMSARKIGTDMSQVELPGIFSRKIGLAGFAICALDVVCWKSWIN